MKSDLSSARQVAHTCSAVLGFQMCDLSVKNKILIVVLEWVSYVHSGFLSWSVSISYMYLTVVFPFLSE